MARRTVFLSYQRSSSKIYARYFGDKIDEWKMDLFLDVEDITQGRFDEIIEREIATRDYFIVILAPTTLQSEWVVREIEAALRHRRRIISILMDGFSFDRPLPPSIVQLKYYHGIPYIHEYSDSFFDKLKKALTTEVSTQPHQLPTVAGYMTRLRQQQARRFWVGVAALLGLVCLAVGLLAVFLSSQGGEDEKTPEATGIVTEEAAITPPPTSTLPATSESLRLVYTDTYAFLVNISSRNQNISNLRFVQVRDGAADIVFEADDWLNQFYPSGRGSIYALPPNGCYQLFRVNIDSPATPQGCGQRFGWLAQFSRRPFWTAADSTTLFFQVYQFDVLVKECAFAAGMCEFSLP